MKDLLNSVGNINLILQGIVLDVKSSPLASFL